MKESVKRILLVSAYFPPSIGGPATFVSSIGPEFEGLGYDISYSNLEPYKHFSKPKRYFLFVREVFKKIQDAHLVIIADTWSVLVPTFFLSLVLRKQSVIRIGGDFVWEEYIDRTKEHIKLSEFYAQKRKLAFKERCVLYVVRACMRYAYAIVFNSKWQRNIWQTPYTLRKEKTFVIQNAFVTEKRNYSKDYESKKTLRCPVRHASFKNTETLKRVWESLKIDFPEAELSFEYIHPDNRTKILSQTYAVIQPSVSDVAPNLIVEAVACGRPFICTEDTGISELVPDTLGMYVDTSNEDVLKKSITDMLQADTHETYVKNIENFSSGRTYKVLAQEYEMIWKR